MHFEVKSLNRSMKMFGTLLITLSAITPASSVFIIAPSVVQQAGTGAFISFIAAAIVGVLTALVYAELSSAYPLTGGEYAIVGRVLGPFAGFIVLGVNLITLILMFAAISLGIASYIQPIFPDVSPVVAGLVNVAITTVCALLNLRTNAIVTGIFLGIEMLVLVVLSYLGFAHISRPLSEFVTHPVLLNSAGTLEPTSVGLIGLATAVAMWAFNGYGQAVYFGEETHDAPKNIARVILVSLFITVFAEAVPVTAVLLGAPDLKTLLGSPSMLTDFIAIRGGETLKMIVSLGIALAIMNANIAMALISARQFFSSGRDHVWPHKINWALTRIHKRFHSPWIATLVFGALASAACFVDINFLFITIGTSLVIIYAALCVAAIVGRRNKTTDHGHYRMPFFPLAPIGGLIALSYVIYANYLDEAVGRPSLVATLAMIVVSAAYYLLVLRRRANGWKLHHPTP